MGIAGVKVGHEPIPGYTLRKRLGAGGYGEVWLADAPGGLQKAVKLVYGKVGETHASNELKALERVRQANHPFLLSLERIEVVDGQVVIVTELAEATLLDRFEKYRRKGAPGIPRAELLDFMRDTADGLDFLAQKHSLQHLDVKPGNLLIIADRVKVADFGLVKDLHDQNQSLVSGLTPTYSAPEIFDGRPDHRSDQYSLAIVYIEMLTGHLPFTGTTTGELARQHISQPPALEALPPADRPVVERALAKNPLDRYATCRQFIEQLQKSRGGAIPVIKTEDKSADPATVTRELPSMTAAFNTCKVSDLTEEFKFQPAENVQDQASEFLASRCLFIGLGETGCRSLLQLRQAMIADCEGRIETDEHGWLAIDTTAELLDELSDQTKTDPLPPEKAIQLPIYRPTEYRKSDPELFTPLSRRWLYNIPKSLRTEGVRPLAILSLLDHYTLLKARVRSELEHVVNTQEADTECQEPVRIYVLASLHGGTGSGLAPEIGLMVRQIMRDAGFTNYRLVFVATAAMTSGGGDSANLQSAAAICSLSELAFLMDGNAEIPPLHLSDRHLGSVNGKPFDWVTLLDGGMHGCQEDAETAVRSMSRYTLLDSQTVVSQLLAESRIGTSAGLGFPWLRMASTADFHLSARLTRKHLARWCTQQAIARTAKFMNGSGKALPLDELTGDDSMDVPITEKTCREITSELLRDLGVVRTPSSIAEVVDHSEGDALVRKWARRMATDPSTVKLQLKQDIETWKNAVIKIVHLGLYNWKQIEKIQLSVIELVLDYCENETTALVKLFQPFGKILGPQEQMLASAVQYLKSFTEECLKLLAKFQSDGKNYAKRLNFWSASISAEKTLNDASGVINVSGLPANLQVLAKRVTTVLTKTLHQESLHILDSAVHDLGLGAGRVNPLTSGNFNLHFVLSQAGELVEQIAEEIGVEPGEIEAVGQDEGKPDAINVRTLDRFAPNLAPSNVANYRFAFTPGEQMSAISKMLSSAGLAETTTVIPVTRTLGTFVACETTDLNVQLLVARQWRPSAATLQLCERLRTRVDIDWNPASQLLEATHLADDPEVEVIVNGAGSAVDDHITPPLNNVPVRDPSNGSNGMGMPPVGSV